MSTHTATRPDPEAAAPAPRDDDQITCLARTLRRMAFNAYWDEDDRRYAADLALEIITLRGEQLEGVCEEIPADVRMPEAA